MKHRLLIGLCGALLMGTACASLANTVTLANDSKSGQPLAVIYKLATKHLDGAVELSRPYAIQLTAAKSIQFDLHHSPKAGVIIENIAGHELPASINAFDKPRQCSLTTDKQHRTGALILSYMALPNHHGNLACSQQGGVPF
ncbi:MAG: hypothetical protein K0U12_06425 [Gammaproteobacteria bacterium]|nr:hypothetical protein [Gammaproteobacteria bacterium]